MVPPYCGSRRRSSGNIMGKSAFCGGVSPAKCTFSYTLSIIDVRLKFIKHFSPGFSLFRGNHKFRRIFCVLFQLFAVPVLRCAVLRKRRFGGSPLPGEIFRRSLLLFRRKTGILGSRNTIAMRRFSGGTTPCVCGKRRIYCPGWRPAGPVRYRTPSPCGATGGSDARCP